MKALSIENLHKSFPNVKAVDGVSFSIEQGDFFGFLGPNGAGKSTIFKLITGELKPDKGTIHLLPNISIATARQVMARELLAQFFELGGIEDAFVLARRRQRRMVA